MKTRPSPASLGMYLEHRPGAPHFRAGNSSLFRLFYLFPPFTHPMNSGGVGANCTDSAATQACLLVCLRL